MNSDLPSPSDVGAERALLGGILQDPSMLLDVVAIAKADDFYRPEHGALYTLLVAMQAARTPIDLITVCNEVVRIGHKDADRYGGLGYLAELPDHCPSTVNLHRYAQIVAEHSCSRKLIEQGTALVNATYARESTPSELATEYVARLLELGSTTGQVRRHWTFRDAITAAEDHRMDVIQGVVPAAIPTGFANTYGLDDMLGGGLRPGELCVIAGPTSMGKTGLALPMAIHMAQGGRRILFFQLETSVVPLTNRIRSYLTLLPPRTFEGEYSASEESLVASVDASLALELYDWPGASMSQISAEARRRWARGGISAIFVDYLQIMTHERERAEPLAQAIGRTTKACKHLAMELRVPLVLLSQLNREYDKRPPPPGAKDRVNGPWWDAVALPQLSDLKESSSIEQDADIVLFPICADKMGLPNRQDGAIVVAKQRAGPRGTADCRWDGPCGAYRPYRRAS